MLDALHPDELTSFTGRAPCILIEISEAKGSTPRRSGTKMLVSATDTLGTIGGGQLEFMAVEAGRDMLAAGQVERAMAVPLGPAIGQCCGGHVSLNLSLLDTTGKERLYAALRAEHATFFQVLIFGAGHVGRALAQALAPLPVRPHVIDVRDEELALLPPDVPRTLAAVPEAHVRDAPPGTAVIILTHDHALDFLLAAEALARTDLCYVGMIGSKTKRATFMSWLSDQPDVKADHRRLVMPIGATENADKRPAVIAALVAAEVLNAIAVWHREAETVNQL